MTVSQFISSPVDGHLGYFQFGITAVIWIILDVLEYLCAAFKIFFFIFGFQQVDYDVSACPFWGFSQTHICTFMAFTKSEKFSATWFLHQSFFPLLEFQWHKCKAYSTASWDSTLFFSLLFLSLLFRKDHFYWFIL